LSNRKTVLFVSFYKKRMIELLRRVGQQGNVARTLDRLGQLALVMRAGAGHAAGQDLAALGHILAQAGSILVVDVLDLIHTKSANLAAATAALRALGTLSPLRTGRKFLLGFFHCRVTSLLEWDIAVVIGQLLKIRIARGQ